MEGALGEDSESSATSSKSSRKQLSGSVIAAPGEFVLGYESLFFMIEDRIEDDFLASVSRP